MLNFFYRALNNKKGFTLIEVLVVVAIIGILAALAAPRILGRIEDARESSDTALARTIENAVAQWMFDNESEVGPATIDASTILSTDYLDQATIDILGTKILTPDVSDGKITFTGKTLTIIYDPANASCQVVPAATT